ncbi:MAG: ATP-binding protein [bacterium]|nr:ATP-binding protein [bacterium]
MISHPLAESMLSRLAAFRRSPFFTPVLYATVTLGVIRLFLGAWAPLTSLILTAVAVIFHQRLRSPAVVTAAAEGKARYESNIYSRFHQMMSESEGSEDLPRRLIALLQDHLGLEVLSLFLRGCEDDYVAYDAGETGADGQAPERLLTSDPFVGLLKYSRKPLFLAESGRDAEGAVSEPALQDRLVQFEADGVVPLHTGEDLIGFIIIDKGNGAVGTLRTRIEGLDYLFTQMASGLQNRYLCEQLQQSQARMRRTDRLALLGTLTAGLAHEIRNPLVSIKTYFQLLPERYDDRDFRERFQKVAANEVDRISRLVEDLLVFARPSNPRFQSVNAHDLLGEVITLIESTADQQGIDLELDLDDEGYGDILCDPEQIKQVLLNICHNAFDAVNGTGVLSMRTRFDNAPEETGFVHIEIEDNGGGMSETELEKLFTPFYTTKPSGTGLGLAISKQIVEEHLGSVSVESRPGEGSTFHIHLPKDPNRHERRKDRSRSNLPDAREMVR